MENKNFKTYSLKKEYPGSPKKGTVVVEKENGYEGLGITFPHKKFVEDYPDNWELQETPIFKMISVIDSKGYIAKGKDVIYGYMYGAYPDHKINSIVRTSDNEEFTVGDEIDTQLCKNVIIENFILGDNTLYIRHTKGSLTIPFKIKNNLFEKLKKSRQKLFTTEDGVNVFENEYFFATQRYKKILDFPQKCKASRSFSSDVFTGLFSTIEKAEEYIKMNKPEFSRNQIIEFLKTFCPGHGGTGLYELFINQHIK